jgi:D-3-phosphoglycerate dehydrogenase
MKALILNHSTYSKNHINIIKKKFSKIYLKDFANKKSLINFLKNKKEEKNPINVIFTSFGILYDQSITKHLDDKKKYLVSPTTSITHINKSKITKNTKIIYLDKKNFGHYLKKIPSTGELTIMLILMLFRRAIPATNSVKKNVWDRDNFIGNEISDKKVGIIGFGRIGKIVSKILESFGAKIYVFEKHKSKINNRYKKANMNFIFSKCDIISVHIDSRKENFNLIGKELINKMKKSAIFINTSRGEIVNENFLISALKKDKIAGAALDVLQGDSSWGKKVKNNKMINYFKNNDNLIITPHLGGNTLEASNKTKELIIKKLINTL